MERRDCCGEGREGEGKVTLASIALFELGEEGT